MYHSVTDHYWREQHIRIHHQRNKKEGEHRLARSRRKKTLLAKIA